MTVVASATHTDVLTTTTAPSSSLLSPNSAMTTTTNTTTAVTGATATQSRIARSKSGADILFDKMKQDQLNHDTQKAVDFLNTTLIDNDSHTSIEIDHLHDELKDGVLLCKYVKKLFILFFLLLFTIPVHHIFSFHFFAMFFIFTCVKKTKYYYV